MSEPDASKRFFGLTPHLDPAPADWVMSSLESWGVANGTPVGAVLPPGYGSYVRILHPAAGRRGGPLTWEAIAQAAGRKMHPAVQFTRLIPGPRRPHFYETRLPHPTRGTLDPSARRALAEVLLRHTAAAEACWFCLWNGYGFQPEIARRYGVVQGRSRGYILLSGPLADVHRFDVGPQIWWPEDRAWCVATEIDFDSTVVACADACAQELLGTAALEALPIGREARLDYFGDEINPVTISAETLERLRQQL